MPGQYIHVEYMTDDYQSKFDIKIQPETKSLILDGRANDDAGNNYTDKFSIKVAGSRRGRGNFARRVWVRFTSEVPFGYSPNGTISLPWLRPEGYSGFTSSSIGTYQGFPVQFVKKQDERFT
jgi:hypothetical protein